MYKLTEEAFVTMGICSRCKKPFGITVDRIDSRHNQYVFVWAFKVNAQQAHREGYDSKSVRGSIVFDSEYPGCPYCEERGFYICGKCRSIVCWHGEQEVICPKCDNSGIVTESDELEIKGGSY